MIKSLLKPSYEIQSFKHTWGNQAVKNLESNGSRCTYFGVISSFACIVWYLSVASYFTTDNKKIKPGVLLISNQNLSIAFIKSYGRRRYVSFFTKYYMGIRCFFKLIIQFCKHTHIHLHVIGTLVPSIMSCALRNMDRLPFSWKLKNLRLHPISDQNKYQVILLILKLQYDYL